MQPANAPETGSSWRRNVLTAGFALFMASGAYNVANPFLPLMLQHTAGLSVKDSILWAGIAQGVQSGTTFISGPIWGYVGDRIGRKPMLIRAQLGSATAMLLLAFSGNLPMILISRFVVGAFGGSNVAGMSFITSTTPRPKLSMAIGIVQAAQLAGSALGPLFGGAFVGRLGFTGTFLAAAFAQYVGAALLILLSREGAVSRPAVGQKQQASGEGTPMGMLDVLKVHAVVTVLAITFALQIGRVMTGPVLPVFAQSLMAPGASVSGVIGMVFFLQAAVGAASAVGVGMVRTRIGVPIVVLVCSVASGLLFFATAGTHTVAQLLVLTALGAVFAGGLQTSTAMLLSTAAPANGISLAFGLLQSTQAISGSLGPVAGGALGASVGVRWVFVASGVLLILGGLATYLGLRRRGQTSATPSAP